MHPWSTGTVRCDTMCDLRAVLGSIWCSPWPSGGWAYRASGVLLGYILSHLCQRTPVHVAHTTGQAGNHTQVQQTCPSVFSFYLCLYVWVLAYSVLHNTCMQYPWSPEEGVGLGLEFQMVVNHCVGSKTQTLNN